MPDFGLCVLLLLLRFLQMSWSWVCLHLIAAAPQKTCTQPLGPLLGLLRLLIPLCLGR